MTVARGIERQCVVAAAGGEWSSVRGRARAAAWRSVPVTPPQSCASRPGQTLRTFRSRPRVLPVPERSRPRQVKGVVTPLRPVPSTIAAPDYSHVEQYDLEGYDRTRSHVNSDENVVIWGDEDIAKIRQSCRLAKQILDFGRTLVKPGVTTDWIDEQVHAAIVASGAYPSPLLYEGFPKSLCTSVNEVVCHGIPDSTVLLEGDIVNLDVTVYLNGFHGDCSATFIVGNKADKHAEHLVHATRKCLERGIEVCGPGVPYKRVGQAIEALAHSFGLNVLPEFAGHGIGKIFHTPPFIFHFHNEEPGVMKPGMVFTIEPCVCEGEPVFDLWPDNWTVATKSGGWSAQFEHTLLITPTGVDVLTR